MEKVPDDHEDVEETEMEGQVLNQEKPSCSQIECRQKFVMQGNQKLSEGVPIPIVPLDKQGLDLDSETGEKSGSSSEKDGKSEDSKKFCCKFCGKSFYQRSSMQVHERVHTGAKPYKCRFCEKTFAAAGHRSVHERVHTGVKPYKCAVCGQTFRYTSALNQHGNSQHPGEKFRSDRRTESGFKCGVCDQFFATVGQQLAHERSHTTPAIITAASGLQPDPLEVKTQEELQVQVDIKESSGNDRKSRDADLNSKPYDCKICGKSFSQKGTLKTHEQLHTGIKPFKCRFCEKTFALAGNCTKHERIHTGGMPYECLICGQRFRQSKSLKFHGDEKHHGKNFWSKSRSESSFKCDICFKVFATLDHKSTHGQSHSSSSKMDPVATSTLTLVTKKKKIDKKSDSKSTETFKCSFCDLVFKQMGHKMNHERSHRKKEAVPYTCNICGRVFRKAKQLELHNRENHGNHDNAKDGPSSQASDPGDAVEPSEGHVTQEGDTPVVKIENSSSPEWNDEEMEAAE